MGFLWSSLKGKKVILASKSPRRQGLLKGLEIDFEVRVNEVDETVPEGMEAAHVAAYLSKLKSDAFTDELAENELVITSDTVVIAHNQALGKPKDEQEAFAMLSSISGTSHEVITAVTIKDQNKSITLEDSAEVIFHELEEEEIWHYITTYKPFDKAGAYGIQEWIGFMGIEKINGSYYTVMGLPLHLIYKALKAW